MNGTRLELDAVTFGYGSARAVVDAVTLEVDPAGLVVLVGANGSGKSTVLRLAAGLLRPRAGAVRLGGIDLATLPPRDRARALAFLPQSVEPVHRLRAREVVELGRHPHRGSAWSSSSAADVEAVDRALEACDVTGLQDRAFDTLSGGERQRVLIAGALAQGGRVLVLDEPTSALDLPHQRAVFELLRARARAGQAVLMATHDLNLAATFGDHVVLLDAGRVRAQGTAEDVIRDDVMGPLLGEGIWIGRHPAGDTPCVLPRRGGTR